MGLETEIVTPEPSFSRAMLTNSTETSAYAAIAPQIADPVTVEGVTAVFKVGRNHTIIYPFIEGADTEVNVITLTKWRRHTGPILVVISGATAASPVAITATAHGLSTDDVVTIASVVGMTQLNGLQYKVTVTDANTFTIPVDGTGFAAYSSGGTATKIRGQTWFNTFMGQWTCTAGGVGCVGAAGGPLLTGERLCDTLVPTGTNNSLVEVQTYSPATDSNPDSPGYFVLDQIGAPLIQANFDKTSGTAANLSVATI